MPSWDRFSFLLKGNMYIGLAYRPTSMKPLEKYEKGCMQSVEKVLERCEEEEDHKGD